MTTKRFALLIVMAALFAMYMPLKTDFRAFYEAAQALRNGQSVYAVEGYYSPIWIAVLYLPYSLVSYSVAVKLHAFIAFVVYGLAVYRLSKLSDRPKLMALCIAPFALYSLQWGNIEYLIMIGVLLPAPIGLWFVLSKPQIGFIVAVVMVLEYAREHSIKKAALIATPVIAALTLSVFAGMLNRPPLNEAWNNSIFPWGLLAGAPLAIYAMLKRDRLTALGAAALSTPYIMITSWVATIPMLFQAKRFERWALVAAIAVVLGIFFVLRVPDAIRAML